MMLPRRALRMTKILSFFLLSSLLGSPWIAIAVLIAIYWVLDRSTLRYLPGPWAAVRRMLARRRLEAAIAHNPHDFRTTLELGRAHLENRRWAPALELLSKAKDAYRDDASVQVLHALARLGSGDREGADEVERLMTANPKLRFGEPWLDAAEILLRVKDAPRAKGMLERFLGQQPSNVKALYLLGRALAATGDAEGARAARAKAWHEFVTTPAFKRREFRVWAYRANPLRPALYGACVLGALVLMGVVLTPST